jgi:hypothetical protein
MADDKPKSARVTQPDGQPPLGKYPSQPLPEAPSAVKTPGFKASAVQPDEPAAEE